MSMPKPPVSIDDPRASFSPRTDLDRLPGPAGPAVIAMTDLTKTYATGDVEVQALRSVSVSIGRGEMVAIMGASGSGKSTLMNIIGTLDRPTAGRYLLDGIPVEELDDVS